MTKQHRRCAWVDDSEIYRKYHDEEWGLPNYDERHLFEMLVLEGAQAGLSWITILKKREAYRQAFDGFNAEKMARYTEKRIERLLQNPGIVRNRLKVNAAVTNARAFLEVSEQQGGFVDYIWQFVDGRPLVNHWNSAAEVPVTTPASDAMSRELKRRGFKFVGSTICYAYMQAVGMVNDHTTDCFRHRECISG